MIDEFKPGDKIVLGEDPYAPLLAAAGREDRHAWRAAAHEAGHVAVAIHLGLQAIGRVWRLEDGTAHGEFRCSKTSDARVCLLVAVAGAVAESFEVEDREDGADLVLVHKLMSAPDCKIGGVPTYDADPEFAASNKRFKSAVAEVETLLRGELGAATADLAGAFVDSLDHWD